MEKNKHITVYWYELYTIDSFANLRRLCVELVNNGYNPFEYSSINDFCLCEGFSAGTSDNYTNLWIHPDCVIRAGDGTVSFEEDIESMGYYFCDYTRLYWYMDDMVYIDFLSESVHQGFVNHQNWYYSDIAGEWVENYYHSIEYQDEQEEEEEEEENDIYTDRYHSRPSYRHAGNQDYNTYSIGIEFEKEDRSIKESLSIREFNAATNNEWRKEEDGSLDRLSGFELISPIFYFDIPYIVNHITSNDVLLDHVNADSCTRCGGHINLSSSMLSSDELYDQIKWYVPLLYALYPKRKSNTYCQSKTIDKIKIDKSKYSSIFIKSNCIEFRIFPQIKNIDQLQFRLKLVKMFIDNHISDFAHLLDIVNKNEALFLSVYTFRQYTLMLNRLNEEISYELNEQLITNQLTQCV